MADRNRTTTPSAPESPMPNATVRATATALPIVIESMKDGIRTESRFRWPMPRPTLLEVSVDMLSTLSAAAMLLAVGFVVGVIWEMGL
jgi:hypothetical protein